MFSEENHNLKLQKAHPLAEESAGDDKGDVDGVAAHDDPVNAFEEASTASSSC